MTASSEVPKKALALEETVNLDLGIPVQPRKDIALLWVEIDGASEVLRQICVDGGLHLPFAVCGTGDVEKVSRRESVPEFQPRALTLGVLLDCGDASNIAWGRVPTDPQSRHLIEWVASTEGAHPDQHALEGCLYAKAYHGTEVGARVLLRADELFPENEFILTRRIATLWTFAELWRDVWKDQYPRILNRAATLFLERYVNGTIPPDPERGYAVYAGLSALRLIGREKEAIGLRFGRIMEAGLGERELALADLALKPDPRRPFGKDGPTVAELTGAKRNPAAQVYQTLILSGPILWPVGPWNGAETGATAPRRLLN